MKHVIILPTYKEKDNIPIVLVSIFENNPGVYVLVVDDNSPDGTASIVMELQSKYKNLSLLERPKKEGLAPAYIDAFKRVLADSEVSTIFMMDADLSHDPKHIREMIEARKKYDVIVGSRYVHGGSTIGWELYRRVLSRCGNVYAKIITGLPVHDCTGGFNAISADFLRRIDFNHIDTAGYAFIMHLKFLLYKEGASFYEIPICFKNRVEGVSKLSNMIVREGIIAPWKMIFAKR